MGFEGRIYYATFDGEELNMLLAATEKGLCWASKAENGQALENMCRKHFPNYSLIEDKNKLNPYWKAFKDYLSGTDYTFDIPLDLHGTPFQLAVWKALRDIPYGETRSYSDLAKAVGNPRGVRAVGTAVGKNPTLIVVPCHRIIQKDGGLGGFSAGIPLKKKLLKHEQS